MLHAQLAALALAAGVLAASGCGSSAKDGSTSTSAGTSPSTTAAQQSSTTPASVPTVTVATGKPLTHAQWRAQGDAICARLATELAGSTSKTQAELANALTQSAVYVRASVIQLAKLVPPPSKETDWQEYLTGLQQVAANSVALAQITKAGGFNSNLPIVTTSQVIHRRIEALARHDGFRSCSRV